MMQKGKESMDQHEMRQKALSYIDEITTILENSPLPEDKKLLQEIQRDAQAINDGHAITWGTLGNLNLIIAGLRVFRKH
jgi:hypothetical protein